ncbi:hypothetical protein PRUB_a2032 [Pseudoalteromonas rubra]|uniref:Uncharacterized protein n=1 Tax=Pseudoalteromonas rubra TaxID=43658 RepID=A0A8T0CHD3_9GAMM|nr:hypothetical protein PRUB_a2032 [Pseudoalteromonas rubra]
MSRTAHCDSYIAKISKLPWLNDINLSYNSPLFLFDELNTHG